MFVSNGSCIVSRTIQIGLVDTKVDKSSISQWLQLGCLSFVAFYTIGCLNHDWKCFLSLFYNSVDFNSWLLLLFLNDLVNYKLLLFKNERFCLILLKLVWANKFLLALLYIRYCINLFIFETVHFAMWYLVH